MKIATNIPLPTAEPKTRRNASQVHETMSTLEIGHSFLLPKNRNRTLPFVHARNLGISVITRTTPSGRIRVWRKH